MTFVLSHEAGQARPVLSTSAVSGVLLDLDGVLTDTARLHEAAWGRLARDQLGGHVLTHQEYVDLIDGKRRQDGLRSLLEVLGRPVHEAEVHHLAALKDRYFQDLLLGAADAGVFPSSADLVRRLRRVGLRTGVVTASRSGEVVLGQAGLADLVDVLVDGRVQADLDLPGKPDPAAFLEAASRLGLRPDRVAVLEDSRAGVAAARRGGFALVIGVDRHGGRSGLLGAGADVVVADLSGVRVVRDV